MNRLSWCLMLSLLAIAPLAAQPIGPPGVTIIRTEANCGAAACFVAGELCYQGKVPFVCDTATGFFVAAFGFSSANCAVVSCNSSGVYGQTCADATGKWKCDGAGVFRPVGPHLFQDDNATSGPEFEVLVGSANRISLDGSASTTLADITVDFTLANPDTAPTNAQGVLTGCTNIKTYVTWLNQSGETMVSPASTELTVSNKRVTVTRPSIPALATHWRTYYSKASESHSTIRACAVPASYTAAATSTFTCVCSASGASPPGANGTGEIPLIRIQDGTIYSAQVTSGVPDFSNLNSVLMMSGEKPVWSADGGSTTATIPTLNASRVLEICPSGCDGDSPVTANLTIEGASPTATDRWMMLMEPGTYDTGGLHMNEFTSYVGRGGATVLTTSPDSTICFDIVDGHCSPCEGIEAAHLTADCPMQIASGGGGPIDTKFHDLVIGRAATGLVGFGITSASSMSFSFFDNKVSALYAGFSNGAGGASSWIWASDNRYTVDKNGGTAVASVYGHKSTDSFSNMISDGESWYVTNDHASHPGAGIYVYLPSGSTNGTRLVFLNSYVRVEQTNASGTGTLHGIYVTGLTGASDTQVVFVNPWIEVISASSSDAVRGIEVDNSSANLTVQVIGGRVITSGGSSNTDIVFNSRLSVLGTVYTSSSGTENPIDQRTGNFSTSLAGPAAANLAAGACAANTIQVDTGGATQEFCICNSGGTALDCIDFTTIGGPKD